MQCKCMLHMFCELRIFFCACVHFFGALEPNVMTLYRSDFFYYSKIWNCKQYPLENVIFSDIAMEFFAILNWMPSSNVYLLIALTKGTNGKNNHIFKCFFLPSQVLVE